MVVESPITMCLTDGRTPIASRTPFGVIRARVLETPAGNVNVEWPRQAFQGRCMVAVAPLRTVPLKKERFRALVHAVAILAISRHGLGSADGRLLQFRKGGSAAHPPDQAIQMIAYSRESDDHLRRVK
jgi:hypothetical protein